MGNIFVSVLMRLAADSPVLAVYLIGVILALVFWRRYPGPCALTLIAMVLAVAAVVILNCLSVYLDQVARADWGWEPVEVARVWSLIAIAGSLVRAVAYGLLLAAVFVGRTRSSTEGVGGRPS
jgi:predicted permease